ncbi:hypothetical protein PDESU_04780 [Pontiella desulfatans]|uniref:CR-type domain-containing protein n=1 Tax=Pontiella desulfatans TaxID=2750659 RepID=A0A6C2U813_PONDE|nr:hypothetical protein [Pontiella desulfatans]VGO16190.1 hypothetical protein PDESU_04780 [Pontiella desulfatans]
MVRVVFKLGVLGMLLALAPVCAANEIVVLGQQPVAEFRLPDGSVLKNAFVWKRNFEGIMIVHDDGQFFMNFKTLPDDWKAAYLGEDAVEEEKVPVPVTVSTDDRYRAAAVLARVPGLSEDAQTWLLREGSDEETKQLGLSLAVFQCLLSNEREMANRFYLITEELGYKIDALKLDKIFNKCPECDGKKEYEQDCPSCEGTGECVECAGTGLVKAGLGKSNQECKACEKTGDCPQCEGKKRLVLPCANCRGRGVLLDQRYCEVNRYHLVRTISMLVDGEILAVTRDESSGVPKVVAGLPGLKEEALGFYLSEQYNGSMDTNILAACVMQTLLKDRLPDADRFNLMLEVRFPKNKVMKIGDYIKVCKTCKASGQIEEDCPTCSKEKQKGKCPECTSKTQAPAPTKGGGSKKSAAKTQQSTFDEDCEVCGGTGICPGCEGAGKVLVRCEECKGRGRLFENLRAEVKLELLVNSLNDYHVAWLKHQEEARNAPPAEPAAE